MLLGIKYAVECEFVSKGQVITVINHKRKKTNKQQPENNESHSLALTRTPHVPHLSMVFSIMACTTLQRAQGFDVASKLPWSQSN